MLSPTVLLVHIAWWIVSATVGPPNPSDNDDTGGPRMLRVKPPVLSATTIFVKDLGMVLSEAKRVNCPVFLAAAAHQQFIRAASSGWGGEDDSSVSRLWEFMGVNVALNQ